MLVLAIPIVFFQEFKGIFTSLIEDCKNINPTSKYSLKRMISATAITCCLEQVLGNDVLKYEVVADLLELFKLDVDVQTKQCPGIDFLLIDLPKSLRCSL